MTQNHKKCLIAFLSVIAIFLSVECYVTYNDLMTKLTLRNIASKAAIDLATTQQKHIDDQPQVQIQARLHTQYNPHDDKSWALKYKITGDRFARFGITARKIQFDKAYTNWDGGKKIPKEILASLTKNTFLYLPHIKGTEDAVALIVETAIAESGGGKDIDEGTGDYGVMQVRIATANDLFAWLDCDHKDIKDSIMRFKNESWSLKDNLIHNIPFGIAIAITDYWRKMGPDFYDHIKTTVDRGVAWKSVYNSSKGLGTVNAYVNRVDYYNRLAIAKN